MRHKAVDIARFKSCANYGGSEDCLPDRVTGAIAAQWIEGQGSGPTSQPAISAKRPTDSRMCGKFRHCARDLPNLAAYHTAAVEWVLAKLSYCQEPVRAGPVRDEKQPPALE